MSDKGTRDALIAQLAARQWGHLTRAQLIGAGLSPRSVTAWSASGRLVSVHAGVYALGYRRVEPIALAMAAVLACGEDAVLSHDSALALWELRRWPRVPEVIALGCVRRPGVRAHRSTTLTRADTTVQRGVPVTRAARALHDMRRRLGDRRRTRLANAARLARVVTADEFAALVGHTRNPTRSGLEDGFWRWIARERLGDPVANETVNGHEVDAYYPRERVIVQIDHFATHGGPVTFAADRALDAADVAAGFRVVRLTRFGAVEAGLLRRILDDGD